MKNERSPMVKKENTNLAFFFLFFFIHAIIWHGLGIGKWPLGHLCCLCSIFFHHRQKDQIFPLASDNVNCLQLYTSLTNYNSLSCHCQWLYITTNILLLTSLNLAFGFLFFFFFPSINFFNAGSSSSSSHRNIFFHQDISEKYENTIILSDPTMFSRSRFKISVWILFLTQNSTYMDKKGWEPLKLNIPFHLTGLGTIYWF